VKRHPAPTAIAAEGSRGAAAPALLVVLAGVCAALHVAKLAPAIGALQAALQITLPQAGFLLSMVQLAGLGGGLLLGLAADRIGARRSVIAGLLILAAASAAGGAMHSVAALLVLRAVEGVGFLLVVLPAPGLVRRLAAPGRTAAVLGLWGSYMPLATALVLLTGPLLVLAIGWRAWWWGLAALTLLMALWVHRAVPVLPPAAAAAMPLRRRQVLQQTLAAPGPWLVAAAFGAYSAQWLSVVGFLPTIYAQAGVPPAANGALTALAAAANIVGNVAGGRLLQRGWPAPRLLGIGFGAMALAAVLAFAWPTLPPAVPYVAVLVFSGIGGLIPATLFSLALRVAPGEHAVASTVGWMQQGSALGQFAGPPLVAALAATAGGWHLTWIVTVGCAALGGCAAWALKRRLG
jgi:MFS transporter, CP family, cyanate transporter